MVTPVTSLVAYNSINLPSVCLLNGVGTLGIIATMVLLTSATVSTFSDIFGTESSTPIYRIHAIQPESTTRLQR